MNSSEKWKFQKARWTAYKEGIRAKAVSIPPVVAPLYGRHSKSFMKGYNETNPKKIAKYK